MKDKYDKAVEYLTANPDEIRQAWMFCVEQRRLDMELNRSI